MISQVPPVTIVRKLAMTPRAVWRMLTDEEAVKQWFSPDKSFEVLRVQSDVRVGGRYRIEMRSRGGKAHVVSGMYRDVNPHAILAFTWLLGDGAADESLVTFELTPAGDGTELLVRHDGFADEATRERHERLWNASIRRLAKAVF